MTRGLGQVAVATLALLVAGPAHAGMTCDDIMNMVDHKVPASVVVDTIASSGSTFSDADVQCLKQRGAPTEVVTKALELKRVTAPTGPAPKAPTAAEEKESRFDQAEQLGDDPLSQASADDDEDAGGEGELAAAIRDYKAKKYRIASYTLYKLLEENAYPEKDSTIKYYLAKSLEALEMPHSAQIFYMEVVKKGPRNPLFKHALPRLARIAELTGNDYELYRVVGKIAPEAYPRQARPQLYYLMGRKSYEAGELSDAVAYFEKVPTNHELYPRAQYYQGIINYERDKLKSAAKAFREVIKAEVPTDDPDIVRDLEELKDLSLINIARIYYGLQKFDNADKYYQKVDRDSVYWPQSLFERAWSNFFLGDLNEALGLLMTVDSPFFSETDFIPDTQYLRALIYFQLCEYPEVDRIIKLYQAKYQPIRAEMQAFIKPYHDAEKPLFDRAFDAYFGPKAKVGSKIPVAAFRKLLRNQDLHATIREMERMDAETASITAQTPQWRDSVGKYLADAIAADRQRYKERAGRLLLSEMQSQYLAIDELLDDSDVLLFELADAQRADYIYKAGKPTVTAVDETPIDFATSPDVIYWPFNGEFWLDELASYRFTERGSCK